MSMEDAKNATPATTKVYPLQASYYSAGVNFVVCAACLKDFQDTVDVWVAKRKLMGPR